MAESMIETLAVIASDQGVELSEQRLEVVADAQAKLRPGLLSLRNVELPFFPGAIEPSTALRWIENGGRSVDV
jgi:hypothetical protein